MGEFKPNDPLQERVGLVRHKGGAFTAAGRARMSGKACTREGWCLVRALMKTPMTGPTFLRVVCRGAVERGRVNLDVARSGGLILVALGVSSVLDSAPLPLE